MKNWMSILTVALVMLVISTPAMAEGVATGDNGRGMIGLGAGLAMGFAAIGGTLGQSNAARGAYESISRNPQAADKLSTPFFVGLAFIESLVIFAFLVALGLTTSL